MRKFFLLSLFWVVVLLSYGQGTLKKMTFEESQTSSFFQKIKNDTEVEEYIAANGASLSIGDTLIIGLPSGSTTSTNIGSASGDVFGVSKANSRSKSSFTTIIMGKPAGFGNVMNAMAGEAPMNAGQEMQGEIVIIASMYVRHKGSKKKPLALNILLGEPNGRAFGMNKYMSIVDYEKSVLAGEIKSLNAPLTRQEAIAKLKEAKDLVDLGLMNEDDFGKLKEELSPVIMGK